MKTTEDEDIKGRWKTEYFIYSDIFIISLINEMRSFIIGKICLV